MTTRRRSPQPPAPAADGGETVGPKVTLGTAEEPAPVPSSQQVGPGVVLVPKAERHLDEHADTADDSDSEGTGP